MQTIIYNGEKVAVQFITKLETTRGNGQDTIFRDEDGCYYFQRELFPEGVHPTLARYEQPPGYRCLLHRVNINAAILWQLDFACDPILRVEAAAILMEGRGYTDPWPVHINAKRAARKEGV